MRNGWGHEVWSKSEFSEEIKEFQDKHTIPEVKLQTVTKSEVGKEIRDFQHIIERTVPDRSPKPKSTKKLWLRTSLGKLLLIFAVTFPICTIREGKDAQQDMGSLVHFYKIRFPQKYLDLSVPSSQS